MLHWATKWGRHLLIASALIMLAGILLLAAWVAGPAPTKSPTSAAAARNAGEPLRILPLGDSITQSDKDHLSYRYNLWVKLIDSGIDFDFVGSLNSNALGNPAWPDHGGRAFDPDHEGHWGWTVEQILRGVRYNQDNRLSEWLKEYTPDIVLLHLGTNDAYRRQRTSSTVNKLKRVIGELRTDNPNVTVLLAKLIPTGNVYANSRIDDLNAQMDGIAAEMTTAASPVIVVDQNSGFDASADTYDGTHPDESGEEKMAARWFDALRRVLDESSPVATRR